MGAEVRQLKLYSRLACARKHQKCKFVPRLLYILTCDYNFQDWDSEVLEDYQGEGSGKGSGISPEEYKGEPIVRISIVDTVFLNKAGQIVSITSLKYKMLLLTFQISNPPPLKKLPFLSDKFSFSKPKLAS